MAVRWYFSYRLSAANVRNLLAERGLDVSRQTVADWAQKFSVLLAAAGRRYARPLGSRWFVDETYVRLGRAWAYLYRAVDEAGQVVDVLLREKRDLESAEAFFVQAINGVASFRMRSLPINTERTCELYASTRRTLSTASQGCTASGR
jgi:transposase-like protein